MSTGPSSPPTTSSLQPSTCYGIPSVYTIYKFHMRPASSSATTPAHNGIFSPTIQAHSQHAL
eukprot:6484662-Amphidinium_carterae.1